MSKKIAILRGINVGGKRKILMADLRKLFEALSFTEVSTYIQSGNVFFNTSLSADNSAIADQIAAAIKAKYDFDVPVVVRTAAEIEAAIDRNPYLTEEVDIKQLYLTFLKETPSDENRKNTERYEYPPDEFTIIDQEVFLFIPGPSHKSKLSNNFFENKLKVQATTRNWKTVLKLLELSTI
ncbi:MAG: DUF1697 domain-containing protein [Bacteroidota bacterium]